MSLKCREFEVKMEDNNQIIFSFYMYICIYYSVFVILQQSTKPYIEYQYFVLNKIKKRNQTFILILFPFKMVIKA